MNTAYLKTLLAIRETGSFLQASALRNLSHSAVSVQMKRLEQQLGQELFHKGKRPAQLTSFGARFCEAAVGVVADVDRLMRLSTTDSTEGLVRIGFVSTTLQTLLPVVLERLGRQFPRLRVNAVSGLSDDLAARVEAETLDFAFVSAPTGPSGNLRVIEYAREPLRIIAPPDAPEPPDPMHILAERGFIGFSGHTWLGAQIRAALRESGVRVNQIVELDSIDAIENLVARGVGVSVVPQRLFAEDLSTRMKCLAFAAQNNERVLSLITHRENDRTTILQAIIDITGARGG